jgi:ABC-type Fe3+ transport system permease subunit
MSDFLLAAGGLVLWIIYVAVDEDAHASIAFVALAVFTLLGFPMFAIWLRRKKGRGGAAAAVKPKRPPEQHFPRIDRRLHGVLAATTLVFVLLTAIGVVGS